MLIKNNHKQIFYINSYNKIEPTDTDSNFSIKLNINPTINYNKVVVLQASIPKTYYIIPAGNNTFILQENTNQIVITIPPGNYNKTSFRTTIQALLTTNSSYGWVYTISESNSSVQADTGKYTFNVSGNIYQPSINFTGINNNCYEQFGFVSGSINSFVSNILVSQNVVNFSLESTLFIHSDICQNNTSDNVLQEIYTPGITFNSFIKYECLDLEFYAKNFIGKSDVYRFYLTDENGIPIDTNGINLCITVCIYEENNINNEIENYIEMRKVNSYLKLKNE